MAIRKRMYRKKRPAKKPALKNLASKMKAIALKQCETKIQSIHRENLQLNHNGTYFLDNMLYTKQGLDDPQGFSHTEGSRVGDEIVARGLKLKFWLSNKGDRPNVMYNIYVFRYNTLDTPTDSIFWCGSDGNGGTMNRMIDLPNSEKVKILKKMTVYSKEQYTATAPASREHSYFRECWLPLNNRKIVYRRDSSGVPKLSDIGVAIVAYDAFGTLPTDTIASFGFSQRLYFKDP